MNLEPIAAEILLVFLIVATCAAVALVALVDNAMQKRLDAIATHINKVQAHRMLRNNAMTSKELREFIVQYRNNLSPELVERIARNVEAETGIKCEVGGAI